MSAAFYGIASDESQVLLLCLRSEVKRWRTDTGLTKMVHTVGRLKRIRRGFMQRRQCAGYVENLLISA